MADNTTFFEARKPGGDGLKGYRVVLSYSAAPSDGENPSVYYGEIDCEDSGGVEVSSDVEITQNPTAAGYNISDHLFRKPVQISISGVFGENGKKAMRWAAPGSDRLTAIQTEFEALQRAGTKFTVCMMRGTDAGGGTGSSSIRYLVRRNMALASLRWTQRQDTLRVSMSFQEVISGTASITDVEKDVRDPNLPEITDLLETTAESSGIDAATIMRAVCGILKDEGLLNDETLKHSRGMHGYYAAAALAVQEAISAAIAGGVLTGLVITAGATFGAVAATALPFIGIIVGAVFVSWYCYSQAVAERERVAKLEKAKSLGHDFNTYGSMTDAEKDEVAERFIDFLGEVYDQINEYFEDCAFYRVPDSDNQEFALQLGDEWFTATLRKNNDTGNEDLRLYRLGETMVAAVCPLIPKTTFNELGDSAGDYIYKDPGGDRIYCLTGSGADDASDMSNTILIVSPRALDGFMDNLVSLVLSAIYGE